MVLFSARRFGGSQLFLSLCLAVITGAPATAVPTFRSFDNRLPNPDRPYDMTSGTVNFFAGPTFGIYDLQLQPRYPAQLDVPNRTSNDTWEFDSSFDVIYRAMVSTGLEPVHQVRGVGTARMVGVAPGDMFHQVFDTELVSLNLFGLSRAPQFMFRESATLRSSGVTTRDDLCPPCAGPLTHWQISSFVDMLAEVSFDGGATWTAGNTSIHIEQPANPLKLADFNADGVVNGADYVVWRRGYGNTFSLADYELWRQQFGQTSSTSAGALLAGVPEPAACVLLTMAAICSLLCLRQSR